MPLSSLCSCKCLKGSVKTYPVPLKDYQALRANTDLSNGEIQHLYNRFYIISEYPDKEPPKHLMKRHFLSLSKIPSNPLFTTILTSMFGGKKVIDFVHFATYLSVFKANTLRTTHAQIESNTRRKYRFLFDMYDSDKDGRIDRDDLIKLLHKMYGDVMGEQQIIDYSLSLLEDLDGSNTGQVIYEDFRKALGVIDMEEALVVIIPEG